MASTNDGKVQKLNVGQNLKIIIQKFKFWNDFRIRGSPRRKFTTIWALIWLLGKKSQFYRRKNQESGNTVVIAKVKVLHSLKHTEEQFLQQKTKELRCLKSGEFVCRNWSSAEMYFAAEKADIGKKALFAPRKTANFAARIDVVMLIEVTEKWFEKVKNTIRL